MAATTTPQTPETELTPELIDRVLRLSRDNLGRLVDLALDHLDEAADDPDEVKAAWKQELARRWEVIRAGGATYTSDEAIAYARDRLGRRPSASVLEHGRMSSRSPSTWIL